jgi:hypothetical protein
MRKILALSGVVLTSLMFTGSALAQGAAPPAPPPGGAPAADGGGDDKKIGIGGDLLFVLPLGDLGDASGPQIGPVLRGGYRVMPNLELTARLGFLLGLKKERSFAIPGLGTATVSSGFNLIPIWAGARYFFMEPQAGLYGAAELGLNILSPTVDNGNAGDSLTRIGANAGVGYVISKELPIDIRAQFQIYNLLLKEEASAGGITISEPTYFGLGISAGYTFQF